VVNSEAFVALLYEIPITYFFTTFNNFTAQNTDMEAKNIKKYMHQHLNSSVNFAQFLTVLWCSICTNIIDHVMCVR
jgi:hypothetical protein